MSSSSSNSSSPVHSPTMAVKTVLEQLEELVGNNPTRCAMVLPKLQQLYDWAQACFSPMALDTTITTDQTLLHVGSPSSSSAIYYFPKGSLTPRSAAAAVVTSSPQTPRGVTTTPMGISPSNQLLPPLRTIPSLSLGGSPMITALASPRKDNSSGFSCFQPSSSGCSSPLMTPAAPNSPLCLERRMRSQSIRSSQQILQQQQQSLDCTQRGARPIARPRTGSTPPVLPPTVNISGCGGGSMSLFGKRSDTLEDIAGMCGAVTLSSSPSGTAGSSPLSVMVNSATTPRNNNNNASLTPAPSSSLSTASAPWSPTGIAAGSAAVHIALGDYFVEQQPPRPTTHAEEEEDEEE